MSAVSLTVKGNGFEDSFLNNISGFNYSTSIMMQDNIDLDTLDIELLPTSFGRETLFTYFRSLSNIVSPSPQNIEATLTVGDYETKFYNILDASPASIEFNKITGASFRFTTFPRKSAKAYDSMQAIYQQNSLFDVFDSVMKDNQIPMSNVDKIGNDIQFSSDSPFYNFVKADGVSSLQFIRQLCMHYGYAIVSRSNKITLIDLNEFNTKEPDITIDVSDVNKIPDGLVSFKPKANLSPILEAISVIKQDPNIDKYQINTLKNNGYGNVVFNGKGGYITSNEFMPLTTLEARARSIIRESQQKLRTISVSFAKIIPIFAGSIAKVNCYDSFFNKNYLVLSSNHFLDRKNARTDLVLIENFNTNSFEVTVDFSNMNQ